MTPSAENDVPACWLGYTRQQIETLMGDRVEAFDQWMYGQTQAICDGRRYDHDKREYEPTECATAPHGVVTYPWDAHRFLGTRHNHDAIGVYGGCPGCGTVFPPGGSDA